jgi:uncharacterized protein YyaL (SSP411 family)
VEETSIASIDLNSIFKKNLIDFDKGGGHSAPKFPMPANWEYLLQYHHLTDNPKALKAVTATLTIWLLAGFMINWVADSPLFYR